MIWAFYEIKGVASTRRFDGGVAVPPRLDLRTHCVSHPQLLDTLGQERHKQDSTCETRRMNIHYASARSLEDASLRCAWMS